MRRVVGESVSRAGNPFRLKRGKMEALYFISFFVFALYNAIIIKTHGIPSSISRTYYLLKDGGKKKDSLWASAFTLFCWAVAFTLMPFWLDLKANDTDLLIFIACSALGLVGTAPAFREKFERKIHNAGAWACFLAAYAWLILHGNIAVAIAATIALVLVYLFVKENRVFWLEGVAFAAIYLALGVELTIT